MEQEHRPVLLEESVRALVVDSNGTYVDATFGRGGHSRAILTRLSDAGRLIAIDRDPEAVAAGRAFAAADRRFCAVRGRFGEITDLLAQVGVRGGLSGILLDLGVSSPQLDTAGRGFSFAVEGPLDLRMDPEQGESAAQWLAHASEDEIATILRDYGEERFARRIARSIVSARCKEPLATTTQLAGVVARSVPTREPGKHPATRTFQALRIRINEELDEIQRCLRQSCDLLATTGRLVVISFHSLEDRIVKRFMRRESDGLALPKGLPVTSAELHGRLRVLGKPLRPSAAEIQANPRARSAVLRVAERLP
ncbi:MAG: 16S rRNA (cytosine(1402)-N(4))-methyltransferase RsmH [Thiocapsa sp.]|nr:16S rRNA (cytosine(1402)-N(4))-methyltransferase RsmH [Thiocapsa sp.]MCG6896621.1 16S rRNA (cytosine(1402)-N(4))-methyltransferase RsmH [Thiocapsa sp.]MCG6986555.1 16S rRNA (cytosine(1402)-N(4))-methyltransferase RsmH [Thiocapsa sp.]